MMFCRIYQFQIEKELDNGGIIQPKTKKHLQKCDTCQTFYHRFVRLDTELKTSLPNHLSDAKLSQITESALQRLSRQSAESVASDRHSIGPEGRFGTVWRSAAAVLLAAVLLTMGYQWVRQSGVKESSSPKFNLQSFSGSLPFEESYAALVTLPEKSILSEFQKLSHDTRRASVFLMNFVPAVPSETQLPSVLETN